MRSRLCSPSLSPICRRPTFSICRRRSHWLCTYINPTFHQPLSSRSPTKRHVHDFISWLLFGRWIPGPHRGLDRSIHHAQTMELVSLGVNENQSILGVGVISSSSLGAGVHLCSINNLAFLDQRNQHTYLLPTYYHTSFFLSQFPPHPFWCSTSIGWAQHAAFIMIAPACYNPHSNTLSRDPPFFVVSSHTHPSNLRLCFISSFQLKSV